MNRLPLIAMKKRKEIINELFMDLLTDVLEVSEYGKYIINSQIIDDNLRREIHLYQELVTNAIGRCREARIDMDEFAMKCDGIITSALYQSEQFTDIESDEGTNNSKGPQMTDEQSFSIQAATETIYEYFSRCSGLITTVVILEKKLTHIAEKIKKYFTPGHPMHLQVPILVCDTRKLLEYLSLPQPQPGYPLQNRIMPGLQQHSGAATYSQHPPQMWLSGNSQFCQAQSQNSQVNPCNQPWLSGNSQFPH